MRKWIPLYPLALFLLGAGLNILAVTVNHGVMPYVQALGYQIFPPGTVTDPRHITWNDHVHLAVLCDWIQIDGGVCSIGDCFLWLGEWMEVPALVAWFTLNCLTYDDGHRPDSK